MSQGGIKKPDWACEECVHAIDKDVSTSNRRVMTCRCALTGHTYGNVIRCPYREDKDA